MNAPKPNDSLSLEYSSDSTPEKRRLIKKTLLVAEDVESDFLLIQSLLGRSYHLIHAWNGMEAVTLFEKSRPDLVLMDLKMPKMDGLEATAFIRNMDQEIPIIMVSTRAYEIDRNAAEKAGCTDFVIKPLTINHLEEVISRYLEKPECTVSVNPVDFKILAVDDLTNDLNYLKNILIHVGFIVETANSGQEALKKITQFVPDLVLLNVNMPGMNGYETLDKIREYPQFQQTPILLFTAKSDGDSLVKAFNKGAADFIRKPFVQTELISRITYQLSLIHARKMLFAQNQELQQTIRARDRMYSILNRDLRAPVASIRMLTNALANLVEQENVSADFRDFVFSVNRVTGDVFSLLDNLLKWTRLQLGKTQLQKQKITLADLIESVSGNYTALAGHRQIVLNTAFQNPDHPEQSSTLKNEEIEVDVEMFKTMLNNLISNSIRFSQPGSQIIVGAEKRGNRMTLYVKDFGKGMSAEECSKLFKPNFKYTSAIAKAENGYGLGLLLCKKFIELHQGHIEIQSEENKGTTVLLEFPVS